ncbi:hypothetical protein ABT297_25605 [Dactylosporangium sp. NPDC000555]|uniref:hypothetical protein n=1 Tax=Dactylosporangium sp. NPDC000555 TaxID=3154260 RepID=UPI00331ABB89
MADCTIAEALAIATAWDSRTTFAALLAVVPVAVWSGFLARSRRAGPAVGAVLLVLLAWIVVPRAIDGSHPSCITPDPTRTPGCGQVSYPSTDYARPWLAERDLVGA